MYYSVIVKEDGSVTVRPDNPQENDSEYQRAREGSVFETRLQGEGAKPDSDHFDVIEIAALLLAAVTAEFKPGNGWIRTSRS